MYIVDKDPSIASIHFGHVFPTPQVLFYESFVNATEPGQLRFFFFLKA